MTPMTFDIDGSTPEVVLERLRLAPLPERAPPADTVDAIQVVTDANITVIPEARRMKFATVTLGSPLATPAKLRGGVLDA